MGAAAPAHPTDETLQSFGAGRLDAILSQAVSTHLDSCTDCRRRVAELSSDSLLGRLGSTQDQPERSGAKRSGRGRSATERDPAASGSAERLSDTLPDELVDHPDYEIIRELGRGGMGVVYLIHNRLMGRQEAIKVMSRHLMQRPAVLERFLREIRSVARLRHPNVVNAYSATRIGENIVYAMEYVEGLDLARLVKAKGPLPPTHACYYVHQAALGLQHAHEQGIVHRDIKPGNLILSRTGERSVVKILDFGLNKATSDDGSDFSLTRQGQMLGTPDYIAPEQTLNAQSVDIRADIYSLGCTLYYLLSGGPPFRGGSLYEVLQAHHSVEAKPLHLLRPEVPAELAAVVARMMAKQPGERFQTPAAVASALTPFFKKGSVVSPPPSEPKAVPAVPIVVESSRPERSGSPAQKGAAAADPVAASPVNPIPGWITLGAGAVAALVALTFAVIWLIPRTGPSPAAPAPNPSAATDTVAAPTARVAKPSLPRPETAISPVAEAGQPNPTKQVETPAAGKSKPEGPPSAVANPPQPGLIASSGEAATSDPPGIGQAHDRQPSSSRALAAVTRRESRPAIPKAVATSPFDRKLLQARPKKPGFALDKVLAKAQSYANQIVIPAGMYHLEHSRADSSSDKRRIVVTERNIQSVRDSTLGMSSASSKELDVEPKLAERLDNLPDDERHDKVAILTLWFDRDANCELVRVEILLRYVTGLKRGTVYPQGDVDYETLVVSPDKTDRKKGIDQDWEEPGRMLHFANLYKKQVLRYKKMLQANEHAQLNSLMSNLWANMMKNAAADAAQQRQLQRAISGR